MSTHGAGVLVPANIAMMNMSVSDSLMQLLISELAVEESEEETL